MSSDASINAKLSEFFRNGRPEIGLEVGSDPGLNTNEFIRIPKSLFKPWAYKLAAGEKPKKEMDLGRKASTSLAEGAAEASTSPGNVTTGIPEDATAAILVQDHGWRLGNSYRNHVLVHEGELYLVEAGGPASKSNRLEAIFVDPPTLSDIQKFIVANTDHISQASITAGKEHLVHALRFWAVVCGLVVGSKQSEWVVSDNTSEGDETVKEMAKVIASMRGEALTASAARVTSWRKTNHCTGGDIATGYPRKWLGKNKAWPVGVDRALLRAAEYRATTTFYTATHATCVHNALALMVPKDPHHWAIIDPAPGLVTGWDMRESTTLRMVPRDQVAGAAMVVDSVACLQMMAREGIAPLLEARHQWKRLLELYREVKTHGMRVATYATWFFDGHPDGTRREPFSQKDPGCAELIGELGTVASKYYAGTTLGKSPSLDNASQQLGTQTARDLWVAYTRVKQAAMSSASVKAFARVKGATSGTFAMELASDTDTVISSAMVTYNAMLAEMSTAMGLTSPTKIDADGVIKNKASTDAVASAATQIS